MLSFPVVPTLLNFISKYEHHPPMTETNQVDYAAIYEALAALMRGDVPKDLNPQTSAKMIEMLKRLHKSFSSFKRTPAAQAGKDQLSRYKQEDMLATTDMSDEAAAALVGANPFQLPPTLFQDFSDPQPQG